MPPEPKESIQDVVESLGRFPVDAFDFLREGLQYTVENVHGEPTPLERRLHEWMATHDITLEKLSALYEAEELPEREQHAVAELGGPDALNRHVDGDVLCRGLRDLAVQKWGLLASTVLRRWNLRTTEDFGRIVFALVENDYLQRQPHDTIDDFIDVYDFEDAFDRAYKIGASSE